MRSIRGKRVLLAMSGGVDSSVAAAMLVDEGAEVTGVFMRLGSPGELLDDGPESCEREACDTGSNPASTPERKPARIGKQGCCSVGDAGDARRIAAHLGIPFYAVNFKREFGRIIDYFVEEYSRGRTPNPCVRCNDWLKFGRLHEYAEKLGAAFVASGHYASIGVHEGRPALIRGVDEQKDQSYVLFGVPPEKLGSMLLPVGSMRKSEIRRIASSRGLITSDKPDSQEICFVPDNDYASLVGRHRPELVASGSIVDRDGRRLGEHGGHHHYTIGQRRGLGISSDIPLYVIEKDPSANTVTVGPKEALLSRSCLAAEANWLVRPPAIGEEIACFARYRSNGPLHPARVTALRDLEGPTPSGRSASFEVWFDEPVESLAPGQAVVLYGGDSADVVLGGGWIIRADNCG